MLRVARIIQLAVLAAMLVAPLTNAGLPELGGAINAVGTARARLVPGQGVAVAGGAFDWTILCDRCLVDVVFESGTIIVVQQGQTVFLPPGAYQFRDFFGLYGYSGTDVEFHGEGKVLQAAWL